MHGEWPGWTWPRWLDPAKLDSLHAICRGLSLDLMAWTLVPVHWPTGLGMGHQIGNVVMQWGDGPSGGAVHGLD